VSAGMNFIPTFYPKVKYLIIFARLLNNLLQKSRFLDGFL